MDVWRHKLKFSGLLFILLTPFLGFVYANEDAKPLTEINVQLKWRHQFQFAGYYAAIKKGYYYDKGLRVNLIERVPGPTPIDKLIFGEADYAIGGVGALVYRAYGVPIVALANIFQYSPSMLVSRYPELHALKGKNVALSAGIMNAEIIAMLQRGGINTSDINTLSSNQTIEGFINGNYDAYNAYVTNETYQLDESETEYYSFFPRDYGINFYGDVLLTMERVIEADINQTIAFRDATLKGWEYAVKHPDEIIDFILANYNTQNKTREHLQYEAQALAKLIYADIIPVGYMNEKRWKNIENTLKEVGELDKNSVDYEGFIFTHYLKKDNFHFFKVYYKEIIALAILFMGSLLVFHNYRLKRIVKSRTKELDEARAQAEIEARTDNLTQLPNRRFFMEMVVHDSSVAGRNNLALSVIYVDIDFFKNINDTYGHAAGDKALRGVADILKRNIRNSDTAARTGGEEFIILCVETSTEDACLLAERIRADVEAEMFSYQGQSFSLTVSLGVASLSSEESIEQLLKKSDVALYKAKESGRNQVSCL